MIRTFKAVLASMAFAALLGVTTSAWADADADNFVKARHAELTSVLHQPASAARAQKIGALLDAMLDYDRLAHDSLGKHWDEHSDAERNEFTDILRKLVRRNYEKNIQKTLNYEVAYLDGTNGGETVMVRTTVKPQNEDDSKKVTVEYKLHKRDGRWAVIDIITDNSSLVNNYRNSFNKTINKDGWDALIKKLRNKLAGTK